MDEQLKETQKQLHQEALSLRERVIEYCRVRGILDDYSGFIKYLQQIADVLAQDPVDARWLIKHFGGIYRVVSDSYLSMTTLGEELYTFEQKIEEFIESITNAG